MGAAEIIIVILLLMDTETHEVFYYYRAQELIFLIYYNLYIKGKILVLFTIQNPLLVLGFIRKGDILFAIIAGGKFGKKICFITER